jgi:hypothetical protein
MNKSYLNTALVVLFLVYVIINLFVLQGVK